MRLILSILLVLVSLNGFAATLNVGSGQTHATIVAAVAAASPGDIIEVYNGTYTANVTVNKANLTIRKASGQAPVISGARIFAGANGVTLDGLIIRDWPNLSSEGGVTIIGYNTWTVRNCVIEKPGGWVTTSSDACIYMRNGHSHLIEDNVIRLSGKGIVAVSQKGSGWGQATKITGNTVTDCTVDGVNWQGNYGQIWDNWIEGNMSAEWVANHPDGIQVIATSSAVDGTLGTSFLEIYRNYVGNHTQNIFVEGATVVTGNTAENISIVGNVVWTDTLPGTIPDVVLDGIPTKGIALKQCRAVKVWNNTIGRHSNSGVHVQSCATDGTIEIKNNVLDVVLGAAIFIDNQASYIASGGLDYNAYHSWKAGAMLQLGGTFYDTVSAIQADPNHAWEGNGISGENIRVNVGPLSCLSLGSTAIGTGLALPGDPEWEFDIRGNVRSSPPSRGAFEFGVDGEVVSASIDPKGWFVSVTYRGMAASGTHSLGYGVTNTPVAPNVVLTLTSPSHTDAGVATTAPRTVLGTKQIRKPTAPGENIGTNPDSNVLYDEVVSGGNLTVKYALSQYVYASDTSVKLTLLHGAYVQGGETNQPARNVAVSNGSTATYPGVIGNWAWPGYQHITGNEITLRAFLVHGFAQEGRPVRAVKFIVTDQAGVSVSTVVNRMVLTDIPGMAVPSPEYRATLNVSALSTPGPLKCDFEAFPWYGGDAVVLKTAEGLKEPTPQPRSLTNLLDRTGTYGVTVAVVSSSGNDGTGQAADIANQATATANPFLTISRAARAISDFNNANRSRNDNGAGQIWLRSGNYNHSGGQRTYGNGNLLTWCILTTHPTDAGSPAVLNARVVANEDGSVSRRYMVSNVNMTATPNNFLFDQSLGHVWFDKCTINDTTIAFAQNTENLATGYAVYDYTRNTIVNIGQGLRPFSTQKASVGIVRGNTVQSATTVRSHMTVGNLFEINGHFTEVIPSANQIPMTNFVYAYNSVMKLAPNTIGQHAFYLAPVSHVNRVGGAVLNNMIECTGSSGGPGALFIAGDDYIGDIKNYLVWNNTVVGGRINFFYNDTGSAARPTDDMSVVDNLSEWSNIKTDTFTDGGSKLREAGRQGNWPALYGVGFSGNALGEVTGFGGGFRCEFPGLYTSWNGTAVALTTYKFRDRKAWDGSSVGAGNGNYRLASYSHAARIGLIKRRWVLPFDLDGRARGASDPIGAYAIGSARRGMP